MMEYVGHGGFQSDRLLVLLSKGIKQGSLMKGEAETLAGKINHYSNLVSGRYERCLIIHLVRDRDSKKTGAHQ